jgi:hypothetical protein
VLPRRLRIINFRRFCNRGPRHPRNYHFPPIASVATSRGGHYLRFSSVAGLDDTAGHSRSDCGSQGERFVLTVFVGCERRRERLPCDWKGKYDRVLTIRAQIELSTPSLVSTYTRNGNACQTFFPVFVLSLIDRRLGAGSRRSYRTYTYKKEFAPASWCSRVGKSRHCTIGAARRKGGKASYCPERPNESLRDAAHPEALFFDGFGNRMAESERRGHLPRPLTAVAGVRLSCLMCRINVHNSRSGRDGPVVLGMAAVWRSRCDPIESPPSLASWRIPRPSGLPAHRCRP